MVMDPLSFAAIVHYIILGGVGAQLVISWYQGRLMWRDYRKRHKINGDPKSEED